MATLRTPGSGCPWDLEQDFASIAPYTIEEAYEVADAIAREDLSGLKDELGDLLFQVVFHARLGEEAGAFDFDAVAAAIGEKLTRRHPHVFGTAEERRRGPEAGSWERIKAEERADGRTAAPGALDGVPVALPALSRAAKLGQRAARAGFDWPDAAGPRDKVDEELAELDAALTGAGDPTEELGDLLFAITSLARHLDIDAEAALTAASRKFERRFRLMETDLGAQDREMSTMDAAALDTAWEAAKKR